MILGVSVPLLGCSLYEISFPSFFARLAHVNSEQQFMAMTPFVYSCTIPNNGISNKALILLQSMTSLTCSVKILLEKSGLNLSIQHTACV